MEQEIASGFHRGFGRTLYGAAQGKRGIFFLDKRSYVKDNDVHGQDTEPLQQGRRDHRCDSSRLSRRTSRRGVLRKTALRRSPVLRVLRQRERLQNDGQQGPDQTPSQISLALPREAMPSAIYRSQG